MTETAAARFEAVNRLADEIQQAINDGEWSRATELEQRRLEALKQLVVEQTENGHGGDLGEFLGDSQDLIRRQIGEVQHHQRRVVREATMIKTGRAATARYRATADQSDQ
ncbi:MAG: hypothetical protein R3305_04290 [Gammaproteobacteria bacterium]|nr:hypothetical protein [Gammaproteobacteria bacterium]